MGTCVLGVELWVTTSVLGGGWCGARSTSACGSELCFVSEPSWSPGQGAIFWLARLSTIVTARASRRESGMDPFYKVLGSC